MAKIYSPGRTTGGNGIASNSLAVVVGDLISITDGFAVKAVATGRVRGIALATQAFTVDNETVMQKKLEFKPFDDYSIVEIAVDAGVAGLDQTKVGLVYNLTAGGIVDGATSATGTQLRLKEMKTATLGLFQIAK